MKFCKLDIPKFCKDIPKGEGKTIECLKKNYEVRLLCLVIRGKKCNFVARTCTYISTADISFLIFFSFKRLCAQHPRLRAVSLFSWSVEQNARDTQMTTRVPVSWPFNVCDIGDELVIVLLLCYFMLRSLV